MVDATFIKSREGDRVVSKAALIISCIREDGHREIIGLKMGVLRGKKPFAGLNLVA